MSKLMINPIDEIVGFNIRRGRLKSGMTQHQLGRRIGVTAQQVQKYEIGKNRVSASRLWEIARTQSIPIDGYFEKIECKGDDRKNYLVDIKPLELLSIYVALPPSKRTCLLNLAKSLAEKRGD